MLRSDALVHAPVAVARDDAAALSRQSDLFAPMLSCVQRL